MMVFVAYLLGDFFLSFRLGWGFSFFVILMMFLELGVIYSYSFCLDFVSYMMVLLTFFIMALMFISLSGDKNMDYFKGSSYMSFMTFCLVVVFLTLDVFIFYFSFEFVVVPIFLMILTMGGSLERLQSSIFLFLYTLVSSMPFLVFSLSFFFVYDSLNFSSFFFISCLGSYWSFFVILVFLVKLPVFTLHLWLPSAHVEAPLVGSMILAGVLLKLGGYGLYSISLLVGESFFFVSSLYMYLGLYGALVMSFVCLLQVDMKSLIAYSSIVHMGPVLFGILSSSWMGWWGAFMIMLSHGICSSGMFYILSLLYERMGSRSLLILKGLNIFIPSLVFFWFFLASSNMSVPPTFNFFSELIFMVGVLTSSFFLSVVLGLIFLLVGIYNIFFFVAVNHSSSVNLFFLSGYYLGFVKEFSILFYHSFPLFCFPLFFSLFLLF